jgi:protein-S-isoprenylcysteine O-methyltransferase Ste14
MHDPARRPATLALPPAVYAAGLAGAWLLQRQWPLPLELGAVQQGTGWGLIAAGLLGFVWALAALWTHRTTVNPYKAADCLVCNGPFAWSRNPIYLCDWLVYAGVTLLLHSVWPLLLAPLVWVVMRHAVIAHEEAHLAARFGAQYTAYCQRVRRWL